MQTSWNNHQSAHYQDRARERKKHKNSNIIKQTGFMKGQPKKKKNASKKVTTKKEHQDKNFNPRRGASTFFLVRGSREKKFGLESARFEHKRKNNQGGG